MNDNIIQVRQLKKNYGSTKALDGISFDVERGTLVSILGPNGAGKTTCLECIEGLLKADEGTVMIDGSAGIQLQSSALPETLRVIDAMRLFCAYRKIPLRRDLLDRFGLTEKMNTSYGSLSTGQKRRLSLALSIIHSPRVVFLDEPSAGLDVQSRIELHRIIKELRESGTTIILATHDMAEAESLSDKIIILLDGRIAAEGSPAEITSTGGSLSRISVRTENDVIAGSLSLIPGIETSHSDGSYQILLSRDLEISVSAILEEIRVSGDRLIDLRIERPSLEERFIEITEAGRQAEGAVS